MKVYSLNAKPGDPRFLQAAQANYWFWQRGYEVVGFDREQLDAGELDRDLLDDIEHTIVYASVAVARDAILRAGRPQPPNLDFPAELETFIGRKTGRSARAESNSTGQPFPLLPITCIVVGSCARFAACVEFAGEHRPTRVCQVSIRPCFLSKSVRR